MISVVVLDRNDPKSLEVYLYKIEHGQDIKELNVAAVIEAEKDFHHPSKCKWCDELRSKSRARRLA